MVKKKRIQAEWSCSAGSTAAVQVEDAKAASYDRLLKHNHLSRMHATGN